VHPVYLVQRDSPTCGGGLRRLELEHDAGSHRTTFILSRAAIRSVWFLALLKGHKPGWRRHRPLDIDVSKCLTEAGRCQITRSLPPGEDPIGAMGLD
jgi:hypothetical protein